MTRLGVNVDHVATVREARGIDVPDPVAAAHRAEHAGADGIVVHLRMDRRHVQERDVRILRQTVETQLNLEMSIEHEIVEFALDLGPDVATLVPERRQEVTTEGGLDVVSGGDRIREVVTRLVDRDIRVALFVDPSEDQLEASLEAGAQAVELHTGDYAETPPSGERREEALQRLRTAAARGAELGLEVAAGHGLNFRNVTPVAAIPEVEELNIGHALIGRSVLDGIEPATRDMKRLIREAAN